MTAKESRFARATAFALVLPALACGDGNSDATPRPEAGVTDTGDLADTSPDALSWPDTDATPGSDAAPDADASTAADAPPDVEQDVPEAVSDAADPNADSIDMSEVDVIGLGAGSPEVVNWPKTAELRSMNIHRGSYYGPESWYFQIDADGYQSWPSYKPYGGADDTPVCGNIWILVKQPNSSRWWAAPIEGLVDFTDIHPAGNLNFDHTNILEGTPLAAPWQPQAGEMYGWMLSTNVFFPGSNGEERSNVILEQWPSG